MPNKYISPQCEPEIIALYATGITTHQVAKEIGCSQTYVMNTLNRNEIPIRSIYHYTRKYDINEQFFDVINTEVKAYWLGFLYSDGKFNATVSHMYSKSSTTSFLTRIF